MRIVLMCITPAYHLLVYNLILKAPYQDATPVTLLFCVGGAIPANYAFMALSSYFLLDTRAKKSVRKFLSAAVLTGTLWLVRFTVVRGLYGFHSDEYMVEGFITRGAWWYMDAYLILLLCYPFLNAVIRRIGVCTHRILILFLGVAVVLFFYRGLMSRAGDLAAFALIYFVMGYLKRKQFASFLFLKTKPRPMFLGMLVCYLILFGIGFYAKWPAFHVEQGVGNDIVQYVISRYNILAAVMGMFVFFFFRSLSIESDGSAIRRIASVTVYVFLLHETLLSVFWKLGYLWFPIEGRPGPELLGWIVVFTGASFAAAFAVQKIYESSVKKIWDVLIERCCGTKLIKKIEEMEERL